jgi:MFS family permease
VWVSTAFVATGTQMESAVLAWYVLELTDSPILVGMIAGARMVLNFLALFAGAMVDRLARNRLLVIVQFIMAGLALLMLSLIPTEYIQEAKVGTTFEKLGHIWPIFAITMGVGIARLFQMPSSQSLIADILPQERISNGAAFNSVAMNIAMLLGPPTGAFMYKIYGPVGAYIVITGLYIISATAALGIRTSGQQQVTAASSVFNTIKEGLLYVKSQQVLWATLLVAVLINIAGWTVHTSLLSIFARETLGLDAGGLGILLLSFGIGSLTGALIFAGLGSINRTGRLMILAVLFWHVLIIILGFNSSFLGSLVNLFCIGLGFASSQVMILTTLLRTTGLSYRGRVMGLRSMAILGFSLGSVMNGFIAASIGISNTLIVVGVIGIVLMLLLVMAAPKLRQS